MHDRLGGYVKMSLEDRRQAVAELADEGESNVAIGKVLGIDEGTVRNDRRSENSEATGKNNNENKMMKIESSENPELGANAPPLDTVAALAVDGEAVRKAQTAATRKAGEDARKAILEALLNNVQHPAQSFATPRCCAMRNSRSALACYPWVTNSRQRRRRRLGDQPKSVEIPPVLASFSGSRSAYAQWQRLVEEQAASGLTQQAFCTRRRVAYATFCTWKRRLRDEVNEQPPGFVEVGLDEVPMPGWDVELDLRVVLRVRRR